jgi:hypothetical protein
VRKSILFCFFCFTVAPTTSTACSGKDPYNPGTPVGTFHVTGRLTKTSCGDAPDPWEFDVRLNHDGAMLYWIQGGLPVSGKVDASARAALQSSSVSDVRPADFQHKLAACSVTRSDLLDVTLDSASAMPTPDPALTTSFSGVLAYSFAPTEGSDCSDQLVAAGGEWSTLPCNVSYVIAGAAKAGPPTSSTY